MGERYGPPTGKWEGHQQADEQRHRRTINDKIARLRARTKQLAQDDVTKIVVAGILLGILDLLDDEL